MRRALGGILVVLAVACGGGGSGRPSAQDRCEDWCERYNADPECGADITSCSASCSSIILSAGSRCSAQVDALFACTEGADLCAAGGVLACSAENTALTTCTSGGGDAGAPVCTVAGTYTRVRGGTSATACGRSIESFTDGTVVITETASGVSITVSGTTANGGETTDCAGTITGCTIEATCVTGGGTVRYELELTGPGFSGTAYVQLDGDCSFPYSIEGSR